MKMEIEVKKGEGWYLDITDHPTFEEWKREVDSLLIHSIGISADDLPDCLYYDWYEDRLRPIRAANQALKNAEKEFQGRKQKTYSPGRKGHRPK